MIFNIYKKKCVFILSLFFCFFFLEACLQIHYLFFKDLSSSRSIFFVDDSDFGYKPSKINLAKGNFNFKTDSNGFREFGDIHSKKLKVFILGDSFTHALDVSNNQTFYHHLKNDFEIFAYGCAGYGTFQEYLVLKKYISLIKPDMIIFQTFENDLIDNSFEIYSKYQPIDTFFNRPFLLNGNTKFLFDLDLRYYFLRKARDMSSLISFSFINFQKIKLRMIGNKKLEEFPDDLELSKQRTRLIFKKIRSLIPRKTRTLIFNAADGSNIFETISKELGFEYLDGIDKALNEARRKEMDIFAKDKAHWNQNGHAIVGKYLLRTLKQVRSIIEE